MLGSQTDIVRIAIPTGDAIRLALSMDGRSHWASLFAALEESFDSWMEAVLSPYLMEVSRGESMLEDLLVDEPSYCAELADSVLMTALEATSAVQAEEMIQERGYDYTAVWSDQSAFIGDVLTIVKRCLLKDRAIRGHACGYRYEKLMDYDAVLIVEGA